MTKPAEEVTPKSAGSALRQLLVGLVLAPIATLTILTGFTLGGQSAGTYAGATPNRSGSAFVTSCDEQGPVSWRGFGMWNSCTADITWQDGKTETRSAPLEFFQPEEVGKTIPIAEVITSNNKGVTDEALSRDVRGQNGGYIVGLIGLILLGGVIALAGLGNLAGFLLWLTRSRS